MNKLIISFFLIANLICAQNKEITQEGLDTINLYRASVEKLDNFKNLLENNENLIGWSYYYRSVGVLKLLQNEYDSVIYYQKKAIQIYNASKVKRDIDEERLLISYDHIGKVLSHEKKDYQNALIHYQKALELCEKYSYKWIAFTAMGIASCHLELGDPKEAIKYYKKALKDSNYVSIPRENIVVNTRLGLTYFEGFQKIDSARYYLERALKLSMNSEYKNNIYAIHAGLARTYEIENKIDSAVYHYRLKQEAYEKYKPKGYPYIELTALADKSYLQIHEAKYQEAFINLKVLRDSISIIKEVNRDVRSLNFAVLDRLILYYKMTNNQEGMAKIFEEKIEFLKVFHKKIFDEKISDLEIEFRSKQKDKSIVQLEKTTKIQNTLIEQKNIVAIALVVLLLLFLIVGILWFRQKNLQSKYERANLEQRLLRSQMNPHFIFNALNVVNSLIRKGSEKSSLYVSNLSNLLRLILDNSREEFVDLEDEIMALENYLILRSDFSTSFVYKITIDDTLNRDTICIPPMLIQPFVENSIEHGIINNEKGEVNIILSSQGNRNLIQCIVEDNGIGYSKGKERGELKKNRHESLSSSIVRERLDIYQKKFKVNLQFKIEDKLDENRTIVGTTVVISIPYLED